MTHKKRMVVGVCGASGTCYAIRLLQVLREVGIETHLVVSSAGHQTRSYETDLSAQDLFALADFWYPPNDIGSAISSGSFQTMGMILAPCSVKSLAEIASGVTNSLLTRSADVTLKERRRLVLMLRETPLHLGHIRNMATVTEMGGIIFPPVPAFYIKPKTLEEVVDHSVGRVLDLFGIESPSLVRWT